MQGKIKRQSLSNRMVHWLVALSTFALIFSGFGQMPMYARYGITKLPGLGWSSDYNLTINVHYIAGASLLFAVIYHVVFHVIRKEFDIVPKRGDIKESALIIGSMLNLSKAPASQKYLAEQRLAYAYIGASFLAVIVTGLVKIYKNIPGAELSHSIIWTATTFHNIAAILLIFGIVGHLAAFIFKENRVLLPAMFTGKIDEEYVKERHSHWYDEINKRQSQQSGLSL